LIAFYKNEKQLEWILKNELYNTRQDWHYFVTYLLNKLNNYMTTGAILKAFRERNNLSQETVASFLEIKRETLSYYESDNREASLNTLEKLADLYRAELTDFFETDCNQIQSNIAFAFRADGKKNLI
jgi:DNA-binding XRE family transcriptional regulator